MKQNIVKISLVIIALIMAIIVLTGCGETTENIQEETNKVEVVNFNFENVENSVNSIQNEDLNKMQSITDLSEYGITAENLAGYVFKINKENKDFWAVLKPIEGKQDEVKEEMELYINSMKSNDDLKIVSKYAAIKTEEYDGCLIYVATAKQNTEILDAIKGFNS